MESQLNLLNEDEIYRSALVPTSKGKRFANYIIDFISFYLFLIIGGLVLGGIISLFKDIDSALSMANSLENVPPILDRIVTMFLYGFYMTMVEIIFAGKSFGKLITKTRAVSWDGSKPTINQFFTRGFSRVVPFDGFSFLGESSNGWHDKWSDTMVVDNSSLPSGNFLSTNY
jgi:uncharacterized RDD family membrane protein YckC